MPDDEELEKQEPIEEAEQEQPEEPERKEGWEWVGSPKRPEAQKSSDGISDLFEVDSEPDTDDVLSVDIDKDVIDGDLDDLVDVTEDDILGDEMGQTELNYRPEQPRRKIVRPRRLPERYTPPTSMGGVR